METGVGPMTDSLFNMVLNQLDNPKIKDYMYQKFFMPLQNELRKYQLIAVSAYFLIVLMLVIIIYLIVTRKCSG